MNSLSYEWSNSTVSDSANLIHRKPVPYKGTKPYVATADVQGYNIIPSELVSYFNRPSRADVLVQANDIIQAKMRGTNKAVKISQDNSGWLFSTGFALFNPELVGNSSDFFYHFIQSEYFLHMRDLFSVGSTQQAISDKDLKKIKIIFPSNKNVQQKIAEILSTIDTAIEKTDSLIKKYKHIKTGLMHNLFTRGVTPDGKLRPTREEAPHLYKETKIGWIPKEWDDECWGFLTISWAMGPRFSADEYNEYGNVATLRTTDLDDDGTINYKTMPIAKLELGFLRNHILQKKDFVITRSGTCGIAAVFEGFKLPVLPGAFLIRYRFKDTLNEKYMKYYVNSDFGQKQVLRIAEGGVQKNLRGTALCKIRIPLPNKDEQILFVQLIEQTEKLIHNEILKYNKLQYQKLGLMNDLLTGKREVKIETEEAAND